MTIEPNGNGMWRVCTADEIVAIFTHKDDAEKYVMDVNKAILAEREACAKLVEGVVDNPDMRVTLSLAANAIRGGDGRINGAAEGDI